MSNPEDRLPSPGLRVLAAVGAVVLLAGAIVLSHSDEASAAGLEAFGSCAELEQHLADASARSFGSGGFAVEDMAEAGDDAASGRSPWPSSPPSACWPRRPVRSRPRTSAPPRRI